MKLKKVTKKKFKKKDNTQVNKTKHSEGFHHEVWGIFLFTLGLLMWFAFNFMDSVGVFGKIVTSTMLGMFGMPAFVIPYIIAIYAGLLIFNKAVEVIFKKFMQTFVLLSLISAIIQTGSYRIIDYEGADFISKFKIFALKGIGLEGGGIFGGIISSPLLTIFKTLGTLIILSATAITMLMILTNVSFLNAIEYINKIIKSIIKTIISFINLIFERSENIKLVRKDETTINKADYSLIDEKESLKKLPKLFTIKNKPQEMTKSDQQISSENEQIENIQPAIVETTLKIVTENNNEMNTTVYDKNMEKPDYANSEEEIDVSKEIDTTLISKYKKPSYKILNENPSKNLISSSENFSQKLEETLKSFGVDAKVSNVSYGPAVTRYEIQPGAGVKVSRIVNLADDIALNLAASGIRIEAPIPGKSAVGIEVPNKNVSAVYLRDIIETKEFEEFPSSVPFAVGKDITGNNVITDISKMPHLLIAGATGSGKSVCINSLIMSILLKSNPDEVKLLMVDPKVVELGVYNGIPHLLIPVVTEPKKAAGALNWAVQEMVSRYKLFADKGVRDLNGYNEQIRAEQEGTPLPRIVIIIDELADLMMVAPGDVEDAICRLAQMARAAGMSLVIATQRPSVDVITGVIKANIPSRIAFAVSSQIDSRTILDMAGAEKLLGKGDMLFYPIGESKPIRLKGVFVSDKEVEKVVEFIKNQQNADYNANIIEEIDSTTNVKEHKPGDNDEFLPQAVEMVIEAGQASVSLIQRKFKVGYARAARIIDQMEERGIVGQFEGSKPRQVLITKQQFQEMQLSQEK